MHPVPDAEPGQGPGRPLPARAGGPPEVSGGYEAHARAAGEFGPQAGHDHLPPADGRAGLRRRHAPRRGVSGARLRHCLRHVSGCPRHHRRLRLCLRPGRHAGGHRSCGAAFFSWPAHAPVQDRHAAARQPPLDRRDEDGAAAGRRDARPVLVFHEAAAGKQGGLLPDLYERKDPRDHQGQPRPVAAVQRHDRVRRPALLPVDRDEDRPLSG